MNSPIRIPTKECIEIFENIEKDNYNDYPSYPAIDCNNLSLVGRDGNIWTSVNGRWSIARPVQVQEVSASCTDHKTRPPQ